MSGSGFLELGVNAAWHFESFLLLKWLKLWLGKGWKLDWINNFWVPSNSKTIVFKWLWLLIPIITRNKRYRSRNNNPAASKLLKSKIVSSGSRWWCRKDQLASYHRNTRSTAAYSCLGKLCNNYKALSNETIFFCSCIFSHTYTNLS